jgi:hypothetical protein
VSEYRGPALITAQGPKPVEVDALLVANRDAATGLTTWGGRVAALAGSSLMAFFGADALTLHVEGQSVAIIMTLLGQSSSEIKGAGPAPF